MVDLDLCYLSARDALKRFRTRALSPVDILEAQIARAEAVEPKVNALACTFFEDALSAARRAEDRYTRTDGRPRALEGLTVAVKEDTAVAGRPRTFGSLIFKDNVADHTNPSVERLVDAGAIDCLVPRRRLEDIGLTPRGTRVYGLANGSEVRMDIAVAEVEFMGEIGGTAVAYGDDDAEPLLGVTALESMGLEVDPQNQTLRKLPYSRMRGFRPRR